MESKSDISLSTDEKKLIEEFKNTYNAAYVRELSDEKKQYASKDNVILQRLVNNLNHPPLNPPYIEGPHTFYRILSRSKRKIFYLFGESHLDTRGHCPPQSMVFHDYIEELSKKTYAFTDLYVELPMLNPTKPEDKDNLSHYDVDSNKTISTGFAVVDAISDMYNDNTLDFQTAFESKITQPRNLRPGFIIESLFNKYQECIQPSTRNAEKCQLMRIHNIDIRSDWSYNMPSHLQFYLTVLSLVLLKVNKTAIEKIRMLKRMGPPIQKILYILIKPDSQISNEIINNIFLTNPSIKKEVEKSYLWGITAFIKYKITEIFRLNLIPDEDYETIERKRIAYFTAILIFIQNEELYSLNEEYKIILEKSIQINNNLIADLDALAMDMYALARIFKLYKPKTEQAQNQPLESINIIIYAGNAHIETYREFLLDDLYSNELYSYQNPLRVSRQGSCVEMKW